MHKISSPWFLAQLFLNLALLFRLKYQKSKTSNGCLFISVYLPYENCETSRETSILNNCTSQTDHKSYVEFF